MNNKLSKYLDPIITLFFLVGVFLLTTRPLRDFDIWFHIKSGEILTQKGVFFYDVFSHSAAGRAWYPYEWLFQVSVYLVQQAFGFESIKYYIAGLMVIMIGAIFITLKKIIGVKTIPAIFVCLIFIVSVFEFITARPQIPA